MILIKLLNILIGWKNYDERSWLINSYINKNIDHKNENWFINGKNRFEDTDWQVAV